MTESAARRPLLRAGPIPSNVIGKSRPAASPMSKTFPMAGEKAPEIRASWSCGFKQPSFQNRVRNSSEFLGNNFIGPWSHNHARADFVARQPFPFDQQGSQTLAGASLRGNRSARSATGDDDIIHQLISSANPLTHRFFPLRLRLLETQFTPALLDFFDGIRIEFDFNRLIFPIIRNGGIQ
jgi:hypothetical protein